MRFSLIVATINRTTELRMLLDSLERQTHRDFEVIVVDQNTDDRLLPILSAFEGRLNIRRIESSPGLSRARNVGLRMAAGDAVCFPDDDCCYAEDLLAKVNELFEANPEWSGIVGDSIDPSGKPNLPWRDSGGALSRAKCWRRAISYAIFVRSIVLERIRGFDPTLGVGSGSPWGSGEDNDFVLRAMDAGFQIQYVREIAVFHPSLFPSFDDARCAKRYSYALGDGKLLQKHPMPLWWQALFFSVPLLRASLSSIRLERKETYFHWLTFQGRVMGFISAGRPATDGLFLTYELEESRDASTVMPLKAFSAATAAK